MSQIDVLVAATSRDVKAEGIAAAVAARTDMTLAANRVLTTTEADALLRAMPRSSPCALVLVGTHDDTEDDAERWLSAWAKLVVLRVDVIDDLVQIAVRDIGLAALLTALRELVDRSGCSPGERLSRVDLRSVLNDSRSRPSAVAHKPSEGAV